MMPIVISSAPRDRCAAAFGMYAPLLNPDLYRCWAFGGSFPRAAFANDVTRPDNRNGRCRNCQAVHNADYFPGYYRANRYTLIRAVLDRRERNKKHA